MATAVYYQRYDDVIVRDLMAGRPCALPASPADCAEAVRRLALALYSDGQIAYLMGKTRRTVLRIRQRHNIPPALTPRSNAYHRHHQHVPARPSAAG